MSKILIIAQHDEGQLNPATAKCVACARAMEPEAVHVALFAKEPDEMAKAAAAIEGVDKVLAVGGDHNEHALAATLAPQIAELADGYTHVLGPSTTFGKDVMPRAAALLGVPQVTDIMEVKGPYEFKRPIYANNAIVTVKAPDDRLLVATVRPASWSEAGKADSPAEVEEKTLDVEIPSHTRFVKLDVDESDRPDLQTASRVVSGGRALGSEDNFDIIYSLADKLGAAVGASRAAGDAGYVPNDMQVGQTGKIVAPEVYIAIGISGAIQHLTGIKDAGTIVAINKDEDAPIFEVADFGLVGDLFKIVPELEKALDK